MSQNPDFLTGKLLVAMPGMRDPRFEHSVVFMCTHSEEGAMGLIVNKPASELSFGDLLEQLDIEPGRSSGDVPIHFGGPVEHGRGFVLHSGDYQVDGATLAVDGGYGMTATVDILRDIAEGAGPARAILALGYAGWAPGQLESEIQGNGWLVCDTDSALLFETPASGLWDGAMARLGIDPRLLSSEGGRA